MGQVEELAVSSTQEFGCPRWMAKAVRQFWAKSPHSRIRTSGEKKELSISSTFRPSPVILNVRHQQHIGLLVELFLGSRC